MEQKDFEQRRQELLYRLHCLPGKMVAAHEYENLAEFVLYDLSHPNCFNLGKAAFFVDNADFDCVQGIAGVSLDEGLGAEIDVWKQYDLFSQQMQQSAFNATVRSIVRPSFGAGTQREQQCTQLAQSLAISNPRLRFFETKHGNTGILIYEPHHESDIPLIQEYLPGSAALLAFCPIR